MRWIEVLKDEKDLFLQFYRDKRTGNQRDGRIRLFEWKGVVCAADFLFVFLFVILILSLRFRLFPFFYSNLSPGAYWGMAVITAAGIVLSIIAHEMVHISCGWERTKLYLSGVAFSLALSAALVGLAFLSQNNAYNEFVIGILFHLGAFNLTFALFQLLPVFPLDGGKLLLYAFSKKGKVSAWVLNVFYSLGVLVSLGFLFVGGYQIYEQRPVLGAWIAMMGLILLKAHCFSSPQAKSSV